MRFRVGMFITVAFIVSVAIGSPQEAKAHGQGLSLLSTSTPYLIDVGYPSQFTAGDATLFDFLLRNIETDELAKYKYVWVRIKQDKQTLLATGIAHQDLGPTTLLYSFPKAGAYELSVSYRNDDETVAEVSFPISVVAASDSRSFDFMNLLIMLGVALLGAAGGFFLTRRSRGQ